MVVELLWQEGEGVQQEEQVFRGELQRLGGNAGREDWQATREF